MLAQAMQNIFSMKDFAWLENAVLHLLQKDFLHKEPSKTKFIDNYICVLMQASDMDRLFVKTACTAANAKTDIFYDCSTSGCMILNPSKRCLQSI